MLVDFRVGFFEAVKEDEAIFAVVELFKEEIDIVVDKVFVILLDEELEVFFGELLFGESKEVSDEGIKIEIVFFELFFQVVKNATRFSW